MTVNLARGTVELRIIAQNPISNHALVLASVNIASIARLPLALVITMTGVADRTVWSTRLGLSLQLSSSRVRSDSQWVEQNVLSHARSQAWVHATLDAHLRCFLSHLRNILRRRVLDGPLSLLHGNRIHDIIVCITAADNASVAAVPCTHTGIARRKLARLADVSGLAHAGACEGAAIAVS